MKTISKTIPVLAAYTFFFAAAAFAQSSALSQQAQRPPQDLAIAKTRILEMIDKRTAVMAAARACVSAATTMVEMHTCGEREHESMESLRPQRPPR